MLTMPGGGIQTGFCTRLIGAENYCCPRGSFCDTCGQKAEETPSHAAIRPKGIKRTEDPLFRANRPIMEFMRTQDPLLHHNHGLIPKISQ